jgi:hypothetical protein
MMDFKQEIHAALQSSKGYPDLSEIVHRHHATGLESRAAYKLLEEIWIEFGFNENRGAECPPR